ncbi:hypothetical protein [Bacillus sp. REN3]|uniref:hypothetical protein n=1 Tax=Bacillus sp. REN3 TaxID=2802440 RepID=UPI001AEF3231|nr:hypothetical protein [Bacillus sp. REN3]
MLLRKFDGINLWKLNKALKKLAFSRMELEKHLEKELIVILVEPKKEKILSTPEVKREIEQTVMNLSGFETLRLCALENCQPQYREKLTQNGVARWIEMPVNRSITYDFKNTIPEREPLLKAYN